MDKSQVLIIEDDASVCELLFSCLTKEGYRVSVSQSGEAALSQIEEDAPDIVILDLNLPGMSGLDVCRTMRQDPWLSKIPVLMLTGKAEEDDIVTGLEVGADDYMTKPFSPRLLTARVKTLLRRGRLAAPEAAESTDEEGASLPGPLIIKTLGNCELRIDDRRLSWAEDFSPAQRQLMAMLVATADGKVSQEEVQVALWPESSTKKARSSFDSLLSRVRRTLDVSLTPFDSKQYLVVKRGYLCLENARIDAHEFIRLVRRGKQQLTAHEYWPAEISFSSAFSLWQGTFVPGNFGSDAAIEYQDELEQLFLESSLSLARLLAENKRFQQAGKLLRDALRYDPTNDSLIKLMHQLYLAEGSPRKASQVLNNYREALHREHYSATEVDEVLQDFKVDLPIASWLVSD